MCSHKLHCFDKALWHNCQSKCRNLNQYILYSLFIIKWNQNEASLFFFFFFKLIIEKCFLFFFTRQTCAKETVRRARTVSTVLTRCSRTKVYSCFTKCSSKTYRTGAKCANAVSQNARASVLTRIRRIYCLKDYYYYYYYYYYFKTQMHKIL